MRIRRSRGDSRITSSLYAGIQLVMPGETARTHRHTASALRFVLDSAGGYTAVDGERATMSFGDLIITPAWTWHDHGNDSREPVIWLDVLDLPVVNQLSCSFAEHDGRETQPVTRHEGDSLLRYGSGMILPLDYAPPGLDSPSFAYPYWRSRKSLAHFASTSTLHAAHGFKMEYVNPVTGGYPMTTIAIFLQLLIDWILRNHLSLHRCHGVLRRRGSWQDAYRRRKCRVGPARHICSALVASGVAFSHGAGYTLQRFRHAGTEDARNVAGGCLRG